MKTGQQNAMMTPQNKMKAAKLGAKVGKFGAIFGLNKFTDNMEMDGFENVVNGEKLKYFVGPKQKTAQPTSLDEKKKNLKYCL